MKVKNKMVTEEMEKVKKVVILRKYGIQKGAK